MMLPTEVTPEVLAELEKDKTRRELVSRVTGNPAARFNDPVLFQAERQLVTLSRETIGIEPEECELLDEMSVVVFRELGVRVVSMDFVCSDSSLIPPEAVVEALLPTPYPTSNLQPAPGPAEEDEDDAVTRIGGRCREAGRRGNIGIIELRAPLRGRTRLQPPSIKSISRRLDLQIVGEVRPDADGGGRTRNDFEGNLRKRGVTASLATNAHADRARTRIGVDRHLLARAQPGHESAVERNVIAALPVAQLPVPRDDDRARSGSRDDGRGIHDLGRGLRWRLRIQYGNGNAAGHTGRDRQARQEADDVEPHVRPEPHAVENRAR